MTEVSGYYFVGIGGIGMSALAKTAMEKGLEVAGSDMKSSHTTRFLEELGARVHFDQGTAAIPRDMTVVMSTATKDHPQVKRAQKLGHKIIHRSDALVEIMGDLKNLLVAGVHGKTTTSALLVSIFTEGRCDPSFCIGGIHAELQTNGKSGRGPFFIAEADESDGTHLKYDGYGGIITSLGVDHIDHYQTKENLTKGMQAFIEKIENPEHLFFCGDDSDLEKLGLKGISYGFKEHNDLRGLNYRQDQMRSWIDIEYEGKRYRDVEIALIGPHMAQNALGAFGLALSLGIDEKAIRLALKNFQGVLRRMQKHYDANELLCFDDYAHHPEAIKLNLEAIKVAFPDRRLVVAFQPHRYSRLSCHLESFSMAFDAADEVFVTEVYAAGEQPVWNVESRDLIQKINGRIPLLAKSKTHAQLKAHLAEALRPFDVFITLGAGDLYEIHDGLKAHFKALGPCKLKAAIISGGQSLEREVSKWSADRVAPTLCSGAFETELITISKEGRWIGKQGPLQDKEALKHYDVIFPILHGGAGENGEIQALLEQLSVPYIGSGVLGCALAMDKEVARSAVLGKGLKVVETCTVTFKEWMIDKKLPNLSFQYPAMIKPASGGSTFGVTEVNSDKELACAIESLFQIDTKLVIEPKLKLRELEFAALETPAGVEILPPGEIFSSGQIYDFDSKYGRGGAISTSANPKLFPEFMHRHAHKVEKVFQALNLEGYARIDFYYDEAQDELIFNEANAIPGLTEWSLFPKILEQSGITLTEFCSRMARLALRRMRTLKRINMQLLKYGSK